VQMDAAITASSFASILYRIRLLKWLIFCEQQSRSRLVSAL
jgi:hypothetical protein